MYLQARVPDKKSDAVSHNFCLGCGMCALNCPTAAIVMEEQSLGGAPQAQVRRSPSLKIHLCVHCGRCAAVCPSGTVQQFHVEEVLHRVQEARIAAVAFFCTGLNLGQPSALESGPVPPDMDLKDARLKPRLQQVRVPEGVLLEEVRCTGRLGARFLLRLIMAGARDMAFFACGTACQYACGGTGIREHVEALQDMLAQYGADKAVRVRVYEGAGTVQVAAVLETMANNKE